MTQLLGPSATIKMQQPLPAFLKYMPAFITIGAIVGMAIHGRIGQVPHYHEFADASVVFGIPHAADVLSNVEFATVALWGWLTLWPKRNDDQLRAGWPGYCLFLIALFLTALGSSYYHLAPDNLRLIGDRLPIALACAGLLVGVRGDTRPGLNTGLEAFGLGSYAIASVGWWVYTNAIGADDLRPYLLLQVLPLVLIPLWQAIYRTPRTDRLAFAAAMALYVLAKVAEISDHQIADALGFVSGHTLKHLLATLATAAVVWGLTRRVRGSSASTPRHP